MGGVKKVGFFLVLVLMFPQVLAQMSSEDQQYIAQVNQQVQEQVISRVNQNVDAKANMCVGYLDGQRDYIEKMLIEYRRDFVLKASISIFGAVFAGIMLSMILERIVLGGRK